MNTQIFENFRNITSSYTFLHLFKKNAPKRSCQKEGGGSFIVFVKASDRATFMAPVTASQRLPPTTRKQTRRFRLRHTHDGDEP